MKTRIVRTCKFCKGKRVFTISKLVYTEKATGKEYRLYFCEKCPQFVPVPEVVRV